MKRVGEMRLIFLCMPVLVVLIQANADAQNARYGPATSTINQSMRSAALGGATVAMEGYAGAALINPATIGVDQTVQIQSYLFNRKGSPFEWPYYSGFGFFSPSIDARHGKGAVSVSLPYYDLNAIRENNPNYFTTEGNFYEDALQLAGAWELNQNVRIGIGLKHFGVRLPKNPSSVGTVPKAGVTANTYSLDLGVLYHKSYDTDIFHTKMSFGGSLLNFGPYLKYTNGGKDPLPLILNAGLGLKVEPSSQLFNRPFFGLGIYGEFSHLLARVDENGHPYSPFKSLFKGWGPYTNFNGQDHYRITTWDQIERRLGFEASLFDIVSVRSGIDYESPKIIPGSGLTHSWGLGLDLYYLVVDYTTIKYDTTKYASNFETTKHAWQATIRIPLDSSPRNFWPKILKQIGFY